MAGNTYSLGNLLLRVTHPAVRHTACVTPRGHAEGGGETCVQLDRSIKQPERFADGVVGPAMDACHSPKIIVVCVETFGRLALGTLDFGLLQFRSNRPDHAGADPVLQVEN